jgi:hypothetical protein
MKTLTAIALVATISLACTNARAQQQTTTQPSAPVIALPEIVVSQPQTTFRNDRGQTTGTAATTGNQTSYRDDRGRTTETATVDSAGTTTFRDSSGRTVGTATAPRRW